MQTFALIPHFRDITQSEEGGAGFGASKQGCLDALGGGDPVGELVMMSMTFSIHQVVDLEEGGEESPE